VSSTQADNKLSGFIHHNHGWIGGFVLQQRSNQTHDRASGKAENKTAVRSPEGSNLIFKGARIGKRPGERRRERRRWADQRCGDPEGNSVVLK
jgi:hypothetical protein